MAFKDVMIEQAERAINNTRKRREELEEELKEVAESENEARAVLQLLKTGKAATNSSTRRMTSPSEYMEAIVTLQEDREEFDHNELAELLGVNRSSASQKVKTLIQDGTLIVTKERGPGVTARKVRLASLDRD